MERAQGNLYRPGFETLEPREMLARSSGFAVISPGSVAFDQSYNGPSGTLDIGLSGPAGNPAVSQVQLSNAGDLESVETINLPTPEDAPFGYATAVDGVLAGGAVSDTETSTGAIWNLDQESFTLVPGTLSIDQIFADTDHVYAVAQTVDGASLRIDGTTISFPENFVPLRFLPPAPGEGSLLVAGSIDSGPAIAVLSLDSGESTITPLESASGTITEIIALTRTPDGSETPVAIVRSIDPEGAGSIQEWEPVAGQFLRTIAAVSPDAPIISEFGVTVFQGENEFMVLATGAHEARLLGIPPLTAVPLSLLAPGVTIVDVTDISTDGLHRVHLLCVAAQGPFTAPLVIGVGDPTPFQNGSAPVDATDDGQAAANDVLEVINFINAFGSGPLGLATVFRGIYLDIDGDNYVAASDALAAINYINAFGSGPIGEGEASAETRSELPSSALDLFFASMELDSESIAISGRKKGPR